MLQGLFWCFRPPERIPQANTNGKEGADNVQPETSIIQDERNSEAVADVDRGNTTSLQSSDSRTGPEPAAGGPSSRRAEPTQQVILPIAAEVHECSPYELMDGLQFTRPLGQGTFGRVLKGTWHGTAVAVKVVVTPALNHIALKETHLGPQLQHPHVVQTYTTRCTRLTDDFFDHMEAHMDGSARLVAGARAAAAAAPDVASAVQAGSHSRVLRGLEGSGDGFGDPEAPLRGDPKMALYGVLYSMQAAVGHWVTLAVMEFCDMQTLHAAISKGIFQVGHGWTQRVAQRALLRTATEVARGLLHLHNAGVVHGDVKPSNILLKSSRADRRGFTAKVSDFGAAHVLPPDARSVNTATWGTASYMAPEHLEAGRVSRATDVHSFGVVLWEMMSQRIPYAGLPQGVIATGIVSGTLQLEWPEEPPPMSDLVDLGRRCTCRDPAGRPGCQEVMLELVRIESALRNHRAGP